ISLANTYDEESPPARRLMLWTANIDEVHDVEVIARTVAGGMGAMLWQYPLGDPSNDFRILYDGTKAKGTSVDPKPSSVLRNNLNGSLASLITGQFCASDASFCDDTG